MFTFNEAERLQLSERGKEIMDDVREHLGQLQAAAAAQRTVEISVPEGYRTQRSIQGWTTVAVTFGLLFSLAWFVFRALERPLADLVAYANQVGTEEPLVPMAADLASGGSLAEVSTLTLRALQNEQHALAGVLWTAVDADAPLVVAATTALDRTRLPEGGSSLAREIRGSREPVYIPTMADSSAYVVRSALAEVVPVSLLVVPLTIGGSTVGVVELAGVRSTERGDLDRFVDRAALAVQDALVRMRSFARKKKNFESRATSKK